jgi:hypothetical protein
MKQGIWVVAIVSMLAVGCGTNSATQATSATSASASAANSAANSAAQGSAPDGAVESGQMIVTLEDATAPDAIQGRALFEKSGLLGTLSQYVNDVFNLPFDIPLVGKQCDEPNAYWNPSDKQMTMCYEWPALALQLFKDDPDPEAAALESTTAVFYHELGHMLIDIYDLPVTGREEDVADQLSAFLLLADYSDGTPTNPDDIQAAKTFATEWGLLSALGGPLEQEAFADVHTPDEARSYNFQCWIYGSNPTANADIVNDGLLPESRAGGCEEEFAKLSRAWSELIDPHVKK